MHKRDLYHLPIDAITRAHNMDSIPATGAIPTQGITAKQKHRGSS